MKILYSTTATVDGGREGHGRTEDGILDVTLTIPKEFGGAGNRGTNPEQLFAVGYAACFQTAMRATAGKEKLNITDSSITATVGVGPRDQGGFGLKVDMAVSVKGISKAEAEALVKKVHAEVCPYSNAIRGNVDVDIKVV